MKTYEMAVICNIFPAPIHVKRPMYPQSPYTAKPCKDLAEPALIIVTDVREPFQMSGRKLTNRWGADEVANDVVNEASKLVYRVNPAQQDVPGIWVSEGASIVSAATNAKTLPPGPIIIAGYRAMIDGKVENVKGRFHIPQTEIDHWVEKQDNLGATIIALMEALEKEGSPVALQTMTNIRPVADQFARWMKLDGMQWQSKLSSKTNIATPCCGTKQPAGTFNCQNCGFCFNEAARNAFIGAQTRLSAAFLGEDDDTKVGPTQIPASPKGKAKEPVTKPQEQLANV